MNLSFSIFERLNTNRELNNFRLTLNTSDLILLKNLLLRDNMKHINVVLIFDSITISNFYLFFLSLGITI